MHGAVDGIELERNGGRAPRKNTWAGVAYLDCPVDDATRTANLFGADDEIRIGVSLSVWAYSTIPAPLLIPELKTRSFASLRMTGLACSVPSPGRGARSLPTKEGGGARRGSGAFAEDQAGGRGRIRPSRPPVRGRRRSAASAERRVAGRQGLEPRLTGPEPVVLPLNDLPVVRKGRIIRVEGPRG